jgi:hypothetical protein
MDLRSQLIEINKRKKQILIKTDHLAKLKSITKNSQELQCMEQQLVELRKQFLNFSVENF